MKRLVFAIAILSALMFACNTTTATPVQLPPASALPAQPSAGTPTITVPPQPQTNVTCNELSFHLDQIVAFNYTCTTVPKQLIGIGAHPQYTQVTLTTYQTGSSESPEIDVFPVQGFVEVNPPDGIASFQSDVQALVGGGTPGKTLPFLNPHEAAQIIYAQYQVLHVPSGSGIRYLTQSAQNFAVINNHNLFYTYQGLTGDGKYAITAILPISNPILPNNGDTYPGGESFQQFSDSFDTYIAATKAQLDAQPPANFSPGLALLDGLVNSIQVQP